MKNTKLIIALLFFSKIVIAQEIPMIKWDRIIITDSELAHLSKTKTYEIKRDDSGTPFIHFNGTEKKKVDIRIIESLYANLNTDLYDTDDPFKMFARDSSCLENEINPIWKLYYRDISDGDQRIDDYALKKITDYGLVKTQVLNQTGNVWKQEAPLVSIEFIYKKESVKFSTNGEHAYMLPWISENEKIYNAKISVLLAKLIPVEDSPNKELLRGSFFSLYLFDDIFLYHIDTFMTNTMFENKYPKLVEKLIPKFEILYAKPAQITAIDWAEDLAADCVSLDLKAPTMVKNVRHKLILGNRSRVFLYPATNFLKEIDAINTRVKSTPIYEYTAACNNCEGIIRFVNDKSFGKLVEKKFIDDLEHNEFPKTKYEDRLEGAILYELKEFRGGKYSYSRWIILEDGTMILWAFSGEYLMNFGKEWTNSLFPCKEIALDDFIK